MAKLTIQQTKAFNKSAIEVLVTIPTPEGFTRLDKYSPESEMDCETREVIFESPDVKIRLTHFPADETKENYVYQLATGHTDFKTQRGWHTFDRLGISDSFYVQADVTTVDVTETINREIARARAAIAHNLKTVQLPGIRFTCARTPEQIAEMKTKLRTGHAVTLAPGGMGTGFILTRLRPRRRYGVTEATPELKKFLDMDTLWLESFDHD